MILWTIAKNGRITKHPGHVHPHLALTELFGGLKLGATTEKWEKQLQIWDMFFCDYIIPSICSFQIDISERWYSSKLPSAMTPNKTTLAVEESDRNKKRGKVAGKRDATTMQHTHWGQRTFRLGKSPMFCCMFPIEKLEWFCSKLSSFTGGETCFCCSFKIGRPRAWRLSLLNIVTVDLH